MISLQPLKVAHKLKLRLGHFNKQSRPLTDG